jgi:hypothetical protein
MRMLTAGWLLDIVAVVVVVAVEQRMKSNSLFLKLFNSNEWVALAVGDDPPRRANTFSVV